MAPPSEPAISPTDRDRPAAQESAQTSSARPSRRCPARRAPPASGSRQLLQDPAHRLTHRALVGHVRRVGGRCQCPIRKELRHGAGDGPTRSTAKREPGHAAGCDLETCRGRIRAEQAMKTSQNCHGHFTKVTLLISCSVVSPETAFSTAESRRKRIPSARIACLICEAGA